MLCFWWIVAGVIYWELLSENTTLTAKYCIKIKKVAAEVDKKGLKGRKIYFRQENAKPHTAGVMNNKT